MPRALIVLNPVSGVGDPQALKQKIEQHFHSHGWETILYQTTGQEVVKDIVAGYTAGGLDLAVAAGGDGTVSQVATGLAGASIPLGVLPTGTWNALSRNLGIPLLPDEALRLLTGPHQIRALDALEVRGNYYLLNVSTGFSSSTIQGTNRAAKRRFGFLAYIANFLMQLVGLRLRAYHLVIDQKHRKVRCAELMIVNSSLVGIGELPTKLNIHPDDGKVEVCIIKPRSIFGLVTVAWNILIGGKNRHPEFRYFTATQSISIRSKRILDLQADGEMIGQIPVEIRVIPGGVHIIVPSTPGPF